MRFKKNRIHVPETEISVSLIRLITFCNINKEHEMARLFKMQLERMEQVIGSESFETN